MEYLCCPKHDVCVICVLNIASDPTEHPDTSKATTGSERNGARARLYPQLTFSLTYDSPCCGHKHQSETDLQLQVPRTTSQVKDS